MDGRSARRDRNRNAVLDAVLELFAEGDLEPSPEDIARRSGVSLRSLYRYTSDRDDLIRAAIERHLAKVIPLARIDDVGEGPFDRRLVRFIEARMRVYEAIAPTARASRLRAPTNELIRERVAYGRDLLREQVELQFAPELSAFDPDVRREVLAAADALTQTETIDLYRHHRGLSAADTARLLTGALDRLLRIN